MQFAVTLVERYAADIGHQPEFKHEPFMDTCPEMLILVDEVRGQLFPHLSVTLEAPARRFVVARIMAQLLDDGAVYRYNDNDEDSYFTRISYAMRTIDMGVNETEARIVTVGTLAPFAFHTVDADVPEAWMAETRRVARAADYGDLADEIEAGVVGRSGCGLM